MLYRILVARLLIFCAFACGVIGLVAGLIECEWRLGVEGWFTGGTLLAVLAVAVFAEQFLVSRRQGEA